MTRKTNRWRGCPKKVDSYAARDRMLRQAGFKSYAHYLASREWQQVRGRVLARDREVCRLCGGVAMEVHHRKYTRSGLRGTNLSFLVALCRHCHRSVEFDDTRKRTLAESELAYRQAESNASR